MKYRLTGQRQLNQGLSQFFSRNPFTLSGFLYDFIYRVTLLADGSFFGFCLDGGVEKEVSCL